MKLKELKKAEMIKINGGDGSPSGDIIITGNNFVENNSGTVIQNSSPTSSPKDIGLVLDVLSSVF